MLKIKKFVIVLLIFSLSLSLAACGGSGSTGGYGVKTLQTLVEQEYFLAFRRDDPIYFYVTAAIETLAAEGRVHELTAKWLGEQIIEFDSDIEALSRLTPPPPQDFIIGIDVNSFPMAYISNGEYWGYDVELALAACERLGWNLKIQPIEKENVYIELSSGNIDCAWGGIAISREEIEKGNFTPYGPYVKNDIVIATRAGSSVWNSMRLNGKNMAMSSTAEALEALNTDEKLANRLGQITRLAGGTTECFEYLYTGKCDTVLTDSTALYYFNCH